MHSVKINNFLNVFDGILFNAHYVRLQFILSKLFECDGVNMKTSIHGNHMDTFVWSNDAATKGVDTCVCHRISDYKKEALNIMNIRVYYNLEKARKNAIVENLDYQIPVTQLK